MYRRQDIWRRTKPKICSCALCATGCWHKGPRSEEGSQGVAVSRPNARSYFNSAVYAAAVIHALLHYCPGIPGITLHADQGTMQFFYTATIEVFLGTEIHWKLLIAETAELHSYGAEQTCLSGLSERMNDQQARKSWSLTNSLNVFKTSSKSLQFAKFCLSGPEIKFSFGQSHIFSIYLCVQHV